MGNDEREAYRLASFQEKVEEEEGFFDGVS